MLQEMQLDAQDGMVRVHPEDPGVVHKSQMLIADLLSSESAMTTVISYRSGSGSHGTFPCGNSYSATKMSQRRICTR